ncbi:hypothetical protein PRIPAC_73503 [Pristionchus pacificus]|uniref:Uncharacterized protein n=1 Tax=Pristionchus pacificus TaxID=54126 RepID=A0A2A6BFR3_PRIPA|nr:hypothetical protein PRIPAC_73503 [Pristionchus pacificus]|eukprot:PDM64703.1 hypothetical protein PRIPAC_52959 [Pristionchus pacificus]
MNTPLNSVKMQQKNRDLMNLEALTVSTSATSSCPTSDLWSRYLWMRSLARRLPIVRPEEAVEEACEEACVTVETASRLSTFLSLLGFTHCL